MVEFPNPRELLEGERSQTPPRTDADEMHEQMKMEKLVAEYNFLLSSQLEEQRKYYETLLVESSDVNHKRVVATIEKEKQGVTKRNGVLSSRVSQLDDELKFVR